MGISKYEAAALYAARGREAAAQILVLDLDDCSYGCCLCSGQGETQLLHSWSSASENLWELCVEAIQKSTGASPEDVRRELKRQMAPGNEILSNYLVSERMMDEALFCFAGRTLRCSEFESLIRPAKNRLEELLRRIGGRMDPSGLAKTELILLGQAQEFFLIPYYVREWFSADPLLPDERFRNPFLKDPCGEIVRIGMELHREKSLAQHSYSLVLYDRETKDRAVLAFIRKGQEKAELQNAEYTGPVLLTEDTLIVRMDDRDLEVKLPYSFAPEDFDLAEVAVGIQKETAALFIRRCSFPGQVYTVELKNQDV